MEFVSPGIVSLILRLRPPELLFPSQLFTLHFVISLIYRSYSMTLSPAVLLVVQFLILTASLISVPEFGFVPSV